MQSIPIYVANEEEKGREREEEVPRSDHKICHTHNFATTIASNIIKQVMHQ